VTRELHRRLDKLEQAVGTRNCTCPRGVDGRRLAVARSLEELEAAHQRFASCPAKHDDDDKALTVVLDRDFSIRKRLQAMQGESVPALCEPPEG